MKTLLFLCAFFVGWINPFTASAQSARRNPQPAPVRADTGRAAPRMALLVRNYGDSVVLRWSPTQAAHWLRGNQLGYQIQRVELSKEYPNGLKKSLSALPIRPWTREQFTSQFKPGDTYIAVAAQMIHGKGYSEMVPADMRAVLKLHQEQTNRHSVALLAADFSPKAANALGLRWVDKTPRKKDAIYVYRVYQANPAPKPNDLRDTASVAILSDEVSRRAAPLLEEVENGDGVITLTWRRRNAEEAFTAFYIERSPDGKQFTRLNKEPYIQSPPDASAPKRDTLRYRTEQDRQEMITYTDSVREHYRPWYYRIVGIDAFGDFSPASEVLTGMSVDLTAPAVPKAARADVIDNRRVQLTWQRNGLEPDLQGYVVGRAKTVDGPFEPVPTGVLPPATLTFSDEKPFSTANYYVVGAIDTAGNVAYTLPMAAPLLDRTPPKAPAGFAAQTDTNGVVTLRWPVGAETDLAGYKVYRSYEQNNDYYQQLTPTSWADTMYRDTLPSPMLNKVVFYKLVAIDESNNHSPLSEPLTVKVPDRLPPMPPVIKDLIANAGGVTLRLIPSSSTDVTEHRLYRQDGTGNWHLLRRMPTKLTPATAIRDTTLVSNHRYAYALTAVDDAGQESQRSFPITVDYVVTKTPTVRNVSARYNADRRSVTLSWTFPSTSEPHHFVIYRAVNNEGLSMFRAVDGHQTEFQDSGLSQNGHYAYAIKVQYHQQGSSPLSELVRINP